MRPLSPLQQAGGGALVIPRKLHAFWGGPRMPGHLARYLRQWKKLHPAWEFTLWTPRNLPLLRNQDMYDHPEKWSPMSNPWQWRSDLARYEILHDIGGVYIDCDLEPLRPIDDLLGAEFIAREDARMVNNAFMGSAPGSAWSGAILDGLRASVEAQPNSRCNRQIGAHYLTRLIRRHPEVRILPAELVYPYHWSELDQRDRPVVEGAYTRHHWQNKRNIEGKP